MSFVSTWPGTKVSQVSFSEDINFEPGASVCACVNTTVRVCVCACVYSQPGQVSHSCSSSRAECEHN